MAPDLTSSPAWRQLPAPETAIVPGAGHAAHVEAPEALVVALVKFMEGR